MPPGITVIGLPELRRALRAVDKSLPREVSKALKEGAKIASDRAAGLEPHRSGTLANSIRPGAAGSKAYIKSSLIYAGIHEFGGRTGIHHSVRIKATSAMQRAVDESRDEIVEKVGDEIQSLARRNGF